MVRLYGPLMSLDASGTIANAVTFSKWKGRNYARQRVIPANPQSGSQTGMRAMLAGLSKAWANLTALQQSYWADLGSASSVSPFNAFVGFNQSRWRQAKGPAIDPTDVSADDTLPEDGARSATGGPRCVNISVAVLHVNSGFMYVLHRLVAPGNAAAPTNAVHVWCPIADGTYTWVDADLEPGLYTYKCSRVTLQGQLALGTVEFSGTAT